MRKEGSRFVRAVGHLARVLVGATPPINSDAATAAASTEKKPIELDQERLRELRRRVEESAVKAAVASPSTAAGGESAADAKALPIGLSGPIAPKACYLVAGSRDYTDTLSKDEAAVTRAAASSAGDGDAADADADASSPASAALASAAAALTDKKPKMMNAYQMLSDAMENNEHIRVVPIQGVGSYPSRAEEAKAKAAFSEHVAAGAGLADAELSDTGEGMARVMHGAGDMASHMMTGLTGSGETGLEARVVEIVEKIKSDLATGLLKARDTIDLVGHSRGAVAILEAAHRLSSDPLARGLRLRLFLNDPVAGVGNNKAEHVALPDNVMECFYYHALATNTPGFDNIPLNGDRVAHIYVPDVHSGMIRGEGTSLLGNDSKNFFVADVLQKSFGSRYNKAAAGAARVMQTHFDSAAARYKAAAEKAKEDELERGADPYDPTPGIGPHHATPRRTQERKAVYEEGKAMGYSPTDFANASDDGSSKKPPPAAASSLPPLS